jgi:hypothetical protein
LVRTWDEGEGALRTVRLSEPLDEPGGLDVLPDGRLLVADTNHHRVVTVDIPAGTVVEIPIAAPSPSESRQGPPLSRTPGSTLRVLADIDLNGADLDLAKGPPVHLNIAADPSNLLGPVPRSWALDALRVSVEVRLGSTGAGVLVVDLIASTCAGDVCTIARSTREHPLTVA